MTRIKQEDAQAIIEATRSHPSIVAGLNEDQIRAEIEATNAPIKSRRFYDFVDGRGQSKDEASREITFTPRRVLRNHGDYSLRFALPKRVIGAVAHELGAYSSNRLARNLRAHQEIMRFMAQSPHPFSLLGKLEVLDYEMPGKSIRETSPVLIIPGLRQEDARTVSDWELSHRVREEESSLGLFKHWKRISPERYV